MLLIIIGLGDKLKSDHFGIKYPVKLISYMMPFCAPMGERLCFFGYSMLHIV